MYTRDGICYDLNKSIYKSTQNGVTFVFSSKLYKEKFESKLKEHRESINKSLSNRFRISIDVSTLADVVLYMKIEKRGFLIEAGFIVRFNAPQACGNQRCAQQQKNQQADFTPDLGGIAGFLFRLYLHPSTLLGG